MRIYLDLDSRLILSTPNRPIRTLEFKRRDNDSLELQFVRGGIVVPVSSGTTVQYGLKPVDQYGAGFFSVGSFVKTGSGEAALFTASVNLNTVPIAQAFDLEPKSISAMLEIEARDGDTVNSSITLPVTLHNDVIRGDEATPAAIPDGKATQTEAQAGTDNTKWMTPMRTKQAITQAASSYAPATGIAPTAITGTAVVTTDERLSNSRTPTVHKSSHAAGGADALTPADIGAAPATDNASVADRAMELWDNPNDTAALRILDSETFFYGRQNSSPQLNPDFQDSEAFNAHTTRQSAFCEAIGTVTIPKAPTSGSYALRSVNGVLSWVAA